MNKLVAALVAGGLLVGAGIVTTVVSAPSTASAQEETETAEKGPFPRILGFLDDVLDELVDDGTIDQAQADAIREAAGQHADEIKAERDEQKELLEGFLDDGVITTEEASQLPDDHFLLGDRFDEAWEDGELTRDELRPHGPRGLFERGLRFGSLLDDGGIDQDEYDALPDDHPLKQADVSEYLDDGLITPDELRDIHHDRKEARSDEDASG